MNKKPYIDDLDYSLNLPVQEPKDRISIDTLLKIMVGIILAKVFILWYLW